MPILSNITTASLPHITYYVYTIEGFFLMLCDFSLVLFLMISSRFRYQKEYIIYSACLTTDALLGVAYFSAGIYRLILYYQGKGIVISRETIKFITHDAGASGSKFKLTGEGSIPEGRNFVFL